MKRPKQQTETIQDIQKEIEELTEFLIFLECEQSLQYHSLRLKNY